MMTPTPTVVKLNDDDDHAQKHCFEILIRNNVDAMFYTVFDYITLQQAIFRIGSIAAYVW